MADRSKILADHKIKGKILVTPVNAALGPLNEVSWVKTGIPETLGFALLQFRYGHQRGVELSTAMARSARKFCRSLSNSSWAVSYYSALSPEEAVLMRADLLEQEILVSIQEALVPLVSWYPHCPFRLLFDTHFEQPTSDGLQSIKKIVASLYERDARDSMMIQATAIWMAFDAGLLKVAKGLALAQFPEIERYPATELSRKVGSSIRSTLNMLMGSPNYSATTADWPRYFWNRNLEIDPCEFPND